MLQTRILLVGVNDSKQKTRDITFKAKLAALKNDDGFSST